MYYTKYYKSIHNYKKIVFHRDTGFKNFTVI